MRAVGALVAVALGSTTLILATGLASSLSTVADGLNRAAAAPVRVEVGGPRGLGGAQPRNLAVDVAELLRAAPGTARVTEVRQTEATVLGVAKPVVVTGYVGDAAWTGYRMISGRWISAGDEVVLPTRLLRSTAKRVGDPLVLRAGQRQVTVHIVGEVFDLDHDGLHVIADGEVVRGLDPDAPPAWFEAAVSPGTDPDAYVNALHGVLPPGSFAWRQGLQDDTITLFVGLIVTLTMLVVAVAGLGVFNTALLNTREQTREIGILKTIGMTPRQVRFMVLTSLAGLGAVTSVLAMPLGLTAHHGVLNAMASAAVTGLPPEFVAVFQPVGLGLLAGAGLAIAVVGALVPAGWAARSRPATAVRAE
jgi:putative ABC transport system permease protein